MSGLIDARATTFATEVYAVRGSTRRFLGFDDDPETIEAILNLPDHASVERETHVERPILDEWLGTDTEIADYGSVGYETFGHHEKWGTPLFRKRRGVLVDHEGNVLDPEFTALIREEHEGNEKAERERTAWDEYEMREAFRSPAINGEIADRFEHRGPDANAGFNDVLSRQRRDRVAEETHELMRSAARSLGDPRWAQRLHERRRFRAYVEAFGQDPDEELIRSWIASTNEDRQEERRVAERAGEKFKPLFPNVYAELNSKLVAKAQREHVALPERW